jgi:hypothetical protein
MTNAVNKVQTMYRGIVPLELRWLRIGSPRHQVPLTLAKTFVRLGVVHDT